ncbi:MAG TPA: GatB/YqeY domain-containing protein [Acidimicrobiia bacterium]|jgi:hypothetical protein|nr:GatB/YqeY domain-containing protein [Acidimicrobiia bacterium]
MGRSIRERITADLADAMKRRDTEVVAVLRTTLAAIGNAEAVPLATTRSWPVVGPTEVPRRELTEDDLARVIRSEAAERQAAAELYRTGGQPAMADRLDADARLLAGYLTSEP